MIDQGTCTLYELYNAYYKGATGSTAGSGATWNLTGNALRPAGWTSADAAGLPIFPGLLRLEEVNSGSIRHAIRFTAQQTDRSYLWPARHQAGAASDPSLPPMGARFRLRAGFDMSRFSAATQVVLKAMQHYGLILADNGSNWYFQGAAETGWSDTIISELTPIPSPTDTGPAPQSAPPRRVGSELVYLPGMRPPAAAARGLPGSLARLLPWVAALAGILVAAGTAWWQWSLRHRRRLSPSSPRT